jgi:hypothetical protein
MQTTTLLVGIVIGVGLAVQAYWLRRYLAPVTSWRSAAGSVPIFRSVPAPAADRMPHQVDHQEYGAHYREYDSDDEQDVYSQ